MTDIATPVESSTADNSSQEPVESVTSINESEPAADIQTADETETQKQETKKEQEEKLLAGKYKSVEELEKGYKEAEKFVGRTAELEKQLAVYKEQEEKAMAAREMQARQNGFSDVEEQQIMADVAVHEFNLFAQALQAGYAGENYNDAYQALLKYEQTGNASDLTMVKRLFTPEALELIAENRKAFKDQKIQEYNQKKQQALFNSAKQHLEEFVKETGDWIIPKERQDVVGLLFNEFGGNLDLKTAKNMIEKIEQGAVERYKTDLKAKEEQQTRAEQMQPPTGASQAMSTSNAAIDWRGASEAEMKKIVSKYL